MKNKQLWFCFWLVVAIIAIAQDHPATFIACVICAFLCDKE
jgi:hypothetical protein